MLLLAVAWMSVDDIAEVSAGGAALRSVLVLAVDYRAQAAFGAAAEKFIS